jgi:hypothetical protein
MTDISLNDMVIISISKGEKSVYKREENIYFNKHGGCFNGYICETSPCQYGTFFFSTGASVSHNELCVKNTNPKCYFKKKLTASIIVSTIVRNESFIDAFYFEIKENDYFCRVGYQMKPIVQFEATSINLNNFDDLPFHMCRQ